MTASTKRSRGHVHSGRVTRSNVHVHCRGEFGRSQPPRPALCLTRECTHRGQDRRHGQYQHPHDTRRVISLERVPLQVLAVDREEDLEDEFVVHTDRRDRAVNQK